MKAYTYRKEYLEKLLSYKDKDLIKVVSGLRRSGKSTLLELFREEIIQSGIKKEQIQFINFELPENYLNKRWDEIYFGIKEKLSSNVANYVFLDEVQNIPQFEKLVDGLFATENVDVYIILGKTKRVGRVVECGGLENRCTARYRGFESLTLCFYSTK